MVIMRQAHTCTCTSSTHRYGAYTAADAIVSREMLKQILLAPKSVITGE